MFAIVDIQGSQYRVQENDKIYVPKISKDAGEKVTFDKVLMISPAENKFEIGTPVLDGKKIEATIVDHVRDEKVIVFKKKRRKGYQKKRGHKQHYTLISIDKIA
ncbi:MAG: 50S ribosomal protein L21 [Ignavibacteriae bacterium]|nr:50S ribosomal protein L21 [Ignavibacteriota bacterium]MCB0724589.1 50S ribosomal protein L21 [Ignavibacteriota bacterium]MCB9242398.1 50S ribosomal protein L21 [Ignavibacteriales bacterium]